MSGRDGKSRSHVLGIDIGGSGIKAAPVDVGSGEFLESRRRYSTPKSGDPNEILDIARDLCRHFSWEGAVGCTFPGVIRDGRTLTAANLDPAWIGMKAEQKFSEKLGSPVTMINDADAAGMAEVALGAARGEDGVVVMITLGTGIGSAVFVGGRLLPNTEFGHLKIDGVEAEEIASSRAKNDNDLGWREWAAHIGAYLREMESLFWPDLFVIGGGISKNFEKFADGIEVDTPVVKAKLQNRAGIVGAALAVSAGNRDSGQ